MAAGRACRRASRSPRRRWGREKYLGDLLNNQWNQATGISRDVALQAGQQGLTANTALANLLQGGYGGIQKLGADIMTSNLSQGLGAAQNLPQSLTSLQNMMLGQSNALNQAGTLQQQYQQQLLNAQQGAFAQQQAFPYQQLQTLLGAVSRHSLQHVQHRATRRSTNPYYSQPLRPGDRRCGGARRAWPAVSVASSTNQRGTHNGRRGHRRGCPPRGGGGGLSGSRSGGRHGGGGAAEVVAAAAPVVAGAAAETAAAAAPGTRPGGAGGRDGGHCGGASAGGDRGNGGGSRPWPNRRRPSRPPRPKPR